MTDWGAHHFDIAQWGLGMDESGPVEIIPPADPKATRGVRYLYANGVEMIHGDSGGVLFIGTEGKILVNRGKFEATPASLGEERSATTRFVSTRATFTPRTSWIACAAARSRSAMWRSGAAP